MNTYFVKVFNGYRLMHDEVYHAASKNDVLKSLLIGCVIDKYTKILIEE